MNKKPDEYDEAADFCLRRILELYRTPFIALDFEKIARAELSEFLRSSFPPIEVSEDAQALVDSFFAKPCTQTLVLSELVQGIEAYADKRSKAACDALMVAWKKRIREAKEGD